MSGKTQHAQNVLANLGTLLPDLESIYKHIHSHPELSMHENRTAGIAADRLRAAGYDVTTGVGTMATVQLSCSEPIWTRYRCMRRRGYPMPAA